MNAAGDVLTSLKDVSGVQGSFLVSPHGTLLARDIAAMFSNDLLDEMGARLVRLVDAFAGSGSEVRSYVLHYREYLLFVRAVGRGALCVLSEPGANMPALRMGATLAARRLGPLVDEVPPPSPSPAPAPTRAPAAPPPGDGTIRYRGAVMPKGE